ncbi:MAG: flagellar basal body-associated FliL family protein [Candidatus Krumholzibacteriia bacterium]|nr:flagellar basal body-associated FliL family protein [bacterium]MCB9515191.1 flagellar basal body-associated FliL family protein [Candidatus Latescibacterota bacterium]
MAEDTKDNPAEEQEEQQAEARPRRSLPRRPIVFAGIAAVELALAFALAHFVILPRLPAQETDAVADSLAALAAAEPQRGNIVLMDDVVVNLQGDDGSHFLKVAPGLEVSDSKVEAEIAERMPELRDLIIDHLASRAVNEVVDREGREKVKQDLLDDINSRLQKGQLLNIYFSDFVVQ